MFNLPSHDQDPTLGKFYSILSHYWAEQAGSQPDAAGLSDGDDDGGDDPAHPGASAAAAPAAPNPPAVPKAFMPPPALMPPVVHVDPPHAPTSAMPPPPANVEVAANAEIASPPGPTVVTEMPPPPLPARLTPAGVPSLPESGHPETMSTEASATRADLLARLEALKLSFFDVLCTVVFWSPLAFLIRYILRKPCVPRTTKREVMA